MRWHCPPGFKIRTLAVRGGAPYLSVTDVPLNIESLRVIREENILKLEGQSGIRTRNLRLSKHAALTTASGPPPSMYWHHNNNV